MRRKDSYYVLMEICSNCKSHDWCTRHKEENYTCLAKDIQKSIHERDNSVQVIISRVSGHKMGSFEIYCNDVLLFSKLNLGYFPHIKGVTNRIFGFIDDVKNGQDLTKYKQNKVSPVKNYSTSYNRPFSSQNSPKKRTGQNQSKKKLMSSLSNRNNIAKTKIAKQNEKNTFSDQKQKSYDKNIGQQNQRVEFILQEEKGKQQFPTKVEVIQEKAKDKQKAQPAQANESNKEQIIQREETPLVSTNQKYHLEPQKDEKQELQQQNISKKKQSEELNQKSESEIELRQNKFPSEKQIKQNQKQEENYTKIQNSQQNQQKDQRQREKKNEDHHSEKQNVAQQQNNLQNNMKEQKDQKVQ